ncbi:MAG TPA: hypothetical protein VG755_14255 [Nannocystaceae bacterium]|nr:hypothetical protein [Nannocystaceae bacterium]
MVSLTVLGTLALAREANAAACHTLNLGAGAEHVIVGRYAEWDPLVNAPVPNAQVDVGVCVITGGIPDVQILPGCDSFTPANAPLVINAGDGNDRVVALQETHGSWFPCENSYILPWKDSSYAFGMVAAMGKGSDEFYGSPESDVASSNTILAVGTVPADVAWDLVCGYAGQDQLMGDKDNNAALGREEWLDGGADGDICDGDGSSAYDGNDSGDVWLSCESFADARNDGGEIDCDATSNPFSW